MAGSAVGVVPPVDEEDEVVPGTGVPEREEVVLEKEGEAIEVEEGPKV